MEFKELLKSRDIHGAQLARRLGFTRSTVSRWVAGKSLPRAEDLPKIAEILNVSCDELLASFKKVN